MVDGLGAMWQRGRATLLRWLHLVQIARTLLVLLTARAEPDVLALNRIGGWRAAATLTPGLVKDARAAPFRDFEAFRLIPETRRKSGPVRSTGPPANAAAAGGPPNSRSPEPLMTAHGSFNRPPLKSNVQPD